ncbi:MAG: hypothetical protein ACOX6J_00735 [Oscillospiraceae bacterium]|jgi:hypothetical protein
MERRPYRADDSTLKVQHLLMLLILAAIMLCPVCLEFSKGLVPAAVFITVAGASIGTAIGGIITAASAQLDDEIRLKATLILEIVSFGLLALLVIIGIVAAWVG